MYKLQVRACKAKNDNSPLVGTVWLLAVPLPYLHLGLGEVHAVVGFGSRPMARCPRLSSVVQYAHVERL